MCCKIRGRQKGNSVILKLKMLRMSTTLLNRPVVSLRSGGQIGIAMHPIINPHNLKIEGWWCNQKGSGGHSVLLASDVREIMPNGLAVNDDDALSHPDDLARHKELLAINFELLDKLVKTKSQKLGKINDYSYEDKGLFIQKLYVSRPLVKVFTTVDTLIIDRTQIIEVTDKYILVRDTEIRATDEEAVPAAAAVPSG